MAVDLGGWWQYRGFITSVLLDPRFLCRLRMRGFHVRIFGADTADKIEDPTTDQGTSLKHGTFLLDSSSILSNRILIVRNRDGIGIPFLR
jgi:hypothetical protein